MQKSIYIKDLKLGQKFLNEAFSLKEIEEKKSRQGKSYLNIKIGDKTGEIRGKVWNESLNLVDDYLKVGDIVLVSGEIQEYNDNPQVIISNMKKASDFPPDEFLETTTRDRTVISEDFSIAIDKMTNDYLKKLALKIWQGEIKDKLLNYPGGEYVHHGYVGGLIEHLWEMWVLAQGYIKLYSKIDRDLLLIGVLTHDLGKIEELEFTGTAIVRNKEGKLLGHLAQGLLMTQKLITEIKGFPEDLKTKIYHLILSHNGSKELGSTVSPQTIEALALYLIDKSSADMNMAVIAIEKGILSGSDFSDYNKWLKSSMYLGDYTDSV